MWSLRKLTTLAVLSALILGTIFSSSLAGCKKEDKAVSVTNDGPVPNEGIPAIDASAPVGIETATFALG